VLLVGEIIRVASLSCASNQEIACMTEQVSISRLRVDICLTVRRGSGEANRLKSGAGNYRHTPLAKIRF
jgi:hypothetical protein